MVMGFNSRLLGPVARASEARSGAEDLVASAPDDKVTAENDKVPVEVFGPAAPARAEGQLLEAWFHEYFARLWRLVARLGLARENIDDVVQETFITASRRHADVRPGSEWPFLVGTAVRLAANHKRRAAARREVSGDELLEHRASALPNAEQLLIEKRLRQELDAALAALSEAHRSVFVLYELEGFSAPEIAEMLGLALGTVASRLGRARAKFSRTAARMQRARLTCQEDS
jgi:RNA polymerase sigma-70 factor, ECF subfamily